MVRGGLFGRGGGVEKGVGDLVVGEVECCGEEGWGDQEEQVLEDPGAEGGGVVVGGGALEIAEDLAWFGGLVGLGGGW